MSVKNNKLTKMNIYLKTSAEKIPIKYNIFSDIYENENNQKSSQQRFKVILQLFQIISD